MMRNCNLELRLVTSTDSDYQHHCQPIMEESAENTVPLQGQDESGIFCNGKVVCDAEEEFKARAIILLASRGMEHKLRNPTGSEACHPPIIQSQLYSVSGLSMRRSLQRFLQKRQHRVQATAPYDMNRATKNRGICLL